MDVDGSKRGGKRSSGGTSILELASEILQPHSQATALAAFFSDLWRATPSRQRHLPRPLQPPTLDTTVHLDWIDDWIDWQLPVATQRQTGQTGAIKRTDKMLTKQAVS